MADPTPNATDDEAFSDLWDEVENRLRTLAAPSGTQQTQALGKLRSLIEAMPVTLIASDVRDDEAPPNSSSWSTLASVTVDVPDGKPNVSVVGTGVTSYRDSGVNAPLVAIFTRVVIQGQVGAAVQSPSTFSGDSFWPGVVSSFWQGDTAEQGSVQVLLQGRQEDPQHLDPMSMNYAGLSAVITFSGDLDG